MKASPDVILRQVAGEYILVPVGELSLRLQGMISLSESGGLLWKRLEGGCTEQELTDALLAEYEVDRPQAERDVRAFLDMLREAGLLEEGNAEPG